MVKAWWDDGGNAPPSFHHQKEVENIIQIKRVRYSARYSV